MMTNAATAAPLQSGADQSGESLAQYKGRMALRAAWIVGILLVLLVLIANAGRNPIPMLEDLRSFGILAALFIIPASLVISAISFVLGINAWNDRVDANRQRGWKLAVIPVSLAYMILVGLIAAVILQLAEPAFPGLALDRFQAAFLAGLVGATLTYWLVGETMRITSGNLLRIAIIVAAAGVYLAASSSDDPFWWTISFSSIGTHGTFTSWVFNATLTFAGLMILIWLPYFMNDLQILVRHGLTTENGAKWMRRGLIALGIAVALVGIFENGVSQLTDTIHNLSAPMMGVFVIILAFSLRRLIPGFPSEVYATSYFLGGALVLGVVFVMTGYFNTAGITIYGAAIAFTWLTLLVGAVEQEANELEPAAFPD